MGEMDDGGREPEQDGVVRGEGCSRENRISEAENAP